MSLRAISRVAVALLGACSFYSGITFDAPDLLVYGAGLLGTVAVEPLPWSAMLGRWTQLFSADPAPLAEQAEA